MLSQISSTIPINPPYQFDPIEISGFRPSVAALQRRIPPRWQSAAWRGLYNPQWPLVFGINQWMEWGIPFSNKSWWMWWYFWRGLILMTHNPISSSWNASDIRIYTHQPAFQPQSVSPTPEKLALISEWCVYAGVFYIVLRIILHLQLIYHYVSSSSILYIKIQIDMHICQYLSLNMRVYMYIKKLNYEKYITHPVTPLMINLQESNCTSWPFGILKIRLSSNCRRRNRA